MGRWKCIISNLKNISILRFGRISCAIKIFLDYQKIVKGRIFLKIPWKGRISFFDIIGIGVLSLKWSLSQLEPRRGFVSLIFTLHWNIASAQKTTPVWWTWNFGTFLTSPTDSKDWKTSTSKTTSTGVFAQAKLRNSFLLRFFKLAKNEIHVFWSFLACEKMKCMFVEFFYACKNKNKKMKFMFFEGF